MWYVIQTETGREEEVLSLMRRLLDKRLCSRYMILEAEWPKRSGGQWLLLRKAMFPGYIFVETKEAEEVFFQLKQIPKLTKILGNEKFEFVPLTEKEILFLKKISGNTEQEIQMLRGDGREESENREKDCFVVRPSEIAVNQDGTIDVIRGTLKAFEKEILRIN